MGTHVTFIAVSTIIFIATILFLWIISTQQRLVILQDHVSQSMSQIEIQLENYIDILTTLLDLTMDYAKYERDALLETIEFKKNVIIAASTSNDVMQRRRMISEVLDRIAIVAERCPELMVNPLYTKTLGTVETIEDMLHTSCLIYNAHVTKLNREIPRFPISIVAGILGFRQSVHLEE